MVRRHRGAAPAPRPAPRVPPRQPGAGAAAGRDAMEIHISSVPRAYLGSNLLVGSSRLEPRGRTRDSARAAAQVWGAAAAPEVPRRGTRGAAAAPEVPPRHLGPAPEVPPRHLGPAPEVPPRHLRCRHHTERKLAGHVDSPSRAQIAPPRWLHTPVGVPWR